MTPEQKDLTPKTTPNWRKQFKENGQIIAIALILVFFIRTFIAEPRYIPSESMLPTLEKGDRVLVEKISYHFQAPKKGDIVVFKTPEFLQQQGYPGDQAFIKRVIGSSQHSISVSNHIVYLDDRPLLETYIAEPPSYSFPPVTIPEKHLFVMGDNRNNSNDSHLWGFLPDRNIIGHAIFRFWPLNRLGWL